MPFASITTDRLEKVLKMLRVLRFLTGKNNRYHPLSRLTLAFGPPQRGYAFYGFSNIDLFTARAAPSAFGTSPDGEVQQECLLPPIYTRGASYFVRRTTTTHYSLRITHSS